MRSLTLFLLAALLIRAQGFPVKKADVTELLRRHGDEDQERLDYPAFLRAVSEKLSERTPQDDMRRAFQVCGSHKQTLQTALPR